MKKKFVIPLLALCIHPVVTTIFDYLLAIYILQDMDALIVSSHYLFFLLALFGSIPNFLLFNVIFLIIIYILRNSKTNYKHFFIIIVAVILSILERSQSRVPIVMPESQPSTEYICLVLSVIFSTIVYIGVSYLLLHLYRDEKLDS